jgi:hypothetical protein
MKSHEIIASTMGDDIAEWRHARYQRTVSPCVYETGGDYYACSKTVPRHNMGSAWEQHPDQHWAAKAGTVLWVSKV